MGRCRECEKAFNNLFGLVRGLLTDGVSKRAGGRRKLGDSCQSWMREEMEQSSSPNGMAFLSPLGEFVGDCRGASGARSSPCGVGCEAGRGFVTKLGGASQHATGCSDVHVEGSDSPSRGRF